MDENQVTRSKLEHLRFIMEEKKARRKARREARSCPYGRQEDSPAWAPSPANGLEVKDKQQDPAVLCELNSGTVVA